MLDHLDLPVCPTCAGSEEHERECPIAYAESLGGVVWGWCGFHKRLERIDLREPARQDRPGVAKAYG